MTIVNTNATIHSGLLVTDNGDALDVDLELIGGRTLRMSVAGDELGTWPIEDCSIESDESGGSFRLRVAGDETVFTPENPRGFVAFAALVSGDVWAANADDEPERAGDTVVSVAADDPVAFLFGAARPSIPRPPLDETFSDPSTEIADVELEADTYGFDPPSVDDLPHEFAVMDAGLEGATSAEEADDTDSVTAETEVAAVEESLLEEDFSAALDEEDALRKRLGSTSVERLASAIGAMADRRGDDEDFEIGPNTVAGDVLESQRTLRDHRSKRVVTNARLKMIGIVASVLLVVGFFALLTPRALDFVFAYEGGPELPPPLTVTETSVAAVPVVSTLEGTTIFERPAYEFIARWDAAGGPINEVLEIRRLPALGPFDKGFTPFMSLVGVVLPNGAVDEFSVVVDPSGPAEYDRIGLQALGVAIAVVDPDLSPAGRAALLGQLGLDVRAPKLDGVNGRTESRGIVYTLFYDPDTTLLTFTIAPVS
jgi:hypothetical protein